MIDYTALAAVSAVLRTGSFEAAATLLGVTQSAVSQRVKALEEKLGTPLVRRTRPTSPTEAGARLLRHAEDVGLLETQLGVDLQGLLPEGLKPLRLALNADSLAAWAMPALMGIRGLILDIVVDDQDHAKDLLRAGEVSAALTSNPESVAGADSHPIGQLRYLACASPDQARLIAAEGVSANSLALTSALAFSRKDRLHLQWAQMVTGRSHAFHTHHIPAVDSLIASTCGGMGWALLPLPLIKAHMADGRLQELIPDRPLDVPLYWQVPRQMERALAPITSALQAAAGKVLLPMPSTPMPKPKPKRKRGVSVGQ